jgi:putative ABC transport system substrate-binding protein
MGSRWALLVWLVVFVLLLSGCGAKEPEVYRVGILAGMDFIAVIADGFQAGMAELGYVEGENIVYDVQTTEFDMDVYKSVLQQFVEDEVDLILVSPTEASMEAKAATEGTDIPVLFSFALIEGMGLVESVNQPGGNMTGVRFPGPDIALKRLDIMRELAPEATRMLIPYQKGYPIVEPQLEALRPAAEAEGITLIEAPAADAAELEAALQAQVQADGIGFDAILFVAEPLAVTPDPFAVMCEFAYEHQVPIGGALMVVEDCESVFGVNVDLFASGELAAPLADKILRGTPAGEIPVVSAENFIQINYKAAQELGITVPDGLLSQADEVIR